MNYLYGFLVLAALGLIYMRIEAGLVKVDRIRFTKSNGGLKVVQLSDLHVNRLKVSCRKILEVLQREAPDLIIITGDFIETKSHMPKLLCFLKEIGRVKGIYACLGNHDYKAFAEDPKGLQSFMREVEKHGITLLQNQSFCIEKGTKKYNIIGISDMRYGHDDIEKALENCCPDAVMNLAFTHNPDLVLKIPKGKIDYLLTGHFHGGQIWMPFNLEFALLRNEKLCKMGIRRGLHKLNGINLYINRGLGNVVFPFRFFSRPEITVFYLP